MPASLSRSLIALALGACLAAPSAIAANMYRYTDENGKTVISSTIPSEATNRGYEILNSQGRVIETVDPAPTEEELAERRRKEAERERRQKQQQADAELLRTYSHPDDAVRAANRKLEERRSLIQLKLGNISVVESQLAEQEQRAANMERAGRKVPESVTKRIEQLRQRIKEIETEIAAHREETQEIREEFKDKVLRLERLTEKERTRAIAPSEGEQP